MGRRDLEPKDDLERRVLTLTATLEVRAGEGDGDDALPVLEGYAAVFSTDTQIGPKAWGFLERIEPGAFKDTIKDDDIRALFNHDSNQVLGRNGDAGTLELREDKTGLKVQITPPDTAVGRDVVTLVQRGDVSGMSISFQTLREEWAEGDEDTGELPRRTLLEAKLFDVGPVTFPAYPTTSVAARDQAKALIEARRPGPTVDHTRAARERELALAEAESCL